MMRHIVAGAVLGIGTIVLGVTSLGGVSGCGVGCPRGCEGNVIAVRVEPPIACVEVYRGEIDKSCGCAVSVPVHNGCTTDLLVGVGDMTEQPCPDSFDEFRCVSVPPRGTAYTWQNVYPEGERRLPFWKGGLKYEVVVDLEMKFDD